jgi:hypothetical protein
VRSSSPVTCNHDIIDSYGCSMAKDKGNYLVISRLKPQDILPNKIH